MLAVLRRGPVVALGLSLALSACATQRVPPGASNPGGVSPTIQIFGEADAVDFIDEVLRQTDIEPTKGWSIQLPDAQGTLEVDSRLGTSRLGIEWVSAEDQQRLGAALPGAAPRGQLRLVSAAPDADGTRAIVLLLYAQSHIYESPPDDARQDSAPALQAKRQLRRDIEDFLDYARAQGLL